MKFEKSENMYLTEAEFKVLCDAMDLCCKIRTHCSHPDCKAEARNAEQYLSLLYSRADLDTGSSDNEEDDAAIAARESVGENWW